MRAVAPRSVRAGAASSSFLNAKSYIHKKGSNDESAAQFAVDTETLSVRLKQPRLISQEAQIGERVGEKLRRRRNRATKGAIVSRKTGGSDCRRSPPCIHH